MKKINPKKIAVFLLLTLAFCLSGCYYLSDHEVYDNSGCGQRFANQPQNSYFHDPAPIFVDRYYDYYRGGIFQKPVEVQGSLAVP